MLFRSNRQQRERGRSSRLDVLSVDEGAHLSLVLFKRVDPQAYAELLTRNPSVRVLYEELDRYVASNRAK